MVSSAVYRYFPSRDDLLTALIVDAYDAVGDAAEQALAARDAVGGRGPLGRREQGDPHVGTREPARVRAHLRQPGARLRGARPTRSTRPHASRSPSCGSSWTASSPARSRPTASPTVPRAVRSDFAQLRAEAAPGVPDAVLSRTFLACAQLLGGISLEMFGHLHNVIHDYDAFFELQMRHTAEFLVAGTQPRSDRGHEGADTPELGEPARLVGGRRAGSNRPWPPSGCWRGSSSGADGVALSRSRSWSARSAPSCSPPRPAPVAATPRSSASTPGRARPTRSSRSAATPTARQLDTFRRTPGVAAMARVHGYALTTAADQNLALATALDTDMGNVVDRSRVIEGRQADPAASDELTIGEPLADQLHLHVGSRLPAQSYTPAQIVTAFSGGNPGRPHGPTVQLHVVGIVRRPLDLGVRSASGGVAIISPGFNARYGKQIGEYTDVLRVKTVHGAADLPRVVAAARKLWGDQQAFQVQGLGIETEGARSAIDVLTNSLWIFAAVTALAGLVAISILLTRDIANVTSTRRPCAHWARPARNASSRSAHARRSSRVGGAVLAGLGALARFAAVPGRARAPRRSRHRCARRLAGADRGHRARRRSWCSRCRCSPRGARRAGWRPTGWPAPRAGRRRSSSSRRAAGCARPRRTACAWRCNRESGTTAVPVRSAFAGAAFGIAGIVAVLVFGASLSHLVATPRLTGLTWDLKTEVLTKPGSLCTDANDFGLARTEGVQAVAAVCVKDVEVDDRAVAGWGLRQLRGHVAPTLVSGRLPRTAGEVALGAVTMRKIHKHIGDTVKVALNDKAHTYTVVGQVALPTIDEPQPLADGALLTDAGMSKIGDSGANETHYLLITAVPGASRAAIDKRIKRARRGSPSRTTTRAPGRPTARRRPWRSAACSRSTGSRRRSPRCSRRWRCSRSATRSSRRCAADGGSSRCSRRWASATGS